MIINTSRYITARKCWRMAFNETHRRLAEGKAWALIDGGSVHAGIATGLASGNWDEAKRDALAEFDKSQENNPFQAFEFQVVDEHRTLVEAMIELYAREYDGTGWIVLQPELEFTYEIPGTLHDCIFVPDSGLYSPDFKEQQKIADSILEGRWKPAKTELKPHYLTGKCDAIVQQDGNIWLFEHKTTSIMNEGFWSQWLMDIQPRAYLWAIWKMLGIMPKGFVLNAIFKPTERQLAQWNAKRRGADVKSAEDYLKFESRKYLCSEAEIMSVERKFKWLGDEWEGRIKSGIFPLADLRTTCFSYNRPCAFTNMCTSVSGEHLVEDPNSYDHCDLRELDYVTKRLYHIEEAEKQEAEREEDSGTF